MDSSKEKLNVLRSEFVKYLETLREYDDYKYVDKHKINIDTWQKICHFRRLKIETEFIIDTYEKDATDKSNLLNNLVRNRETMIAFLETTVNIFKNQKLHYEYDPKVKKILILRKKIMKSFLIFRFN